MKNDWILDVLADLKTFAHSNELPVLAEQLEETARVATAELASGGKGLLGDAKLEPGKPERNSGEVGTGL